MTKPRAKRTKKKTPKQLQKQRPLSYPLRVYRTPDGKLHPECCHCHGSGKMWLIFSDTDHPGSSVCRPTKYNCRACGGLGYEKYNVAIMNEVTS